MLVLAINAGSQTVKYKLYQLQEDQKENQNFDSVKEGKVVDIGFSKVKDHKQAMGQIQEELKEWADKIEVIGHRYVNGGLNYRDPIVVNDDLIKELAGFNNLAPLHNPFNLEGIMAARELFPEAKNVVVFDTGFYKDLPERAWRYGLNRKVADEFGFRRLGFHGISHQWAVEQAMRELGAGELKKSKAGGNELEESETQRVGARKITAESLREKPDEKAPRKDAKIISVHLGGGASITASKAGKAIDTSMGFTPLEGLMMMTRSGDIDDGIVLELFRRKEEEQKDLKTAIQEMDDLLNKESGLYGLCGKQGMLEILDNLNEPEIKIAFEIFVYRIRKYIGAYFAALNGCDALVFTGTVGAGRPETRESVLENTDFLKDTRVLVIEPDEEQIIAKEAVSLN